MASKKFGDFVKQKELGIDPAAGLAGYGYDGPYAYPKTPPKGVGVAAGEPLPYSNPDEPDDTTGQVWVARDSDWQKKPLGAEETKGMATAAAELTPVKKTTVRQTNPWKPIKAEAAEFAAMPTAAALDLLAEDREQQLTPITDLYGNQFTPEPNQTIQHIMGVIGNSPRMMDRFVIEAKARGLTKPLLESLMQHRECFDGLVDAFGAATTGKSHTRQLAQALHDKYAAALEAVDFDGGVMGEGVDAAPDKRFGPFERPHTPHHHKHKHPHGGPKDHDDPEARGSTGGMPPAAADKGMPGIGGGGMGDPTSGTPDFGQGPVQPPGGGIKKLLKAETAAGNLFGASASFPPLKSLMEGFVRG